MRDGIGPVLREAADRTSSLDGEAVAEPVTGSGPVLR